MEDLYNNREWQICLWVIAALRCGCQSCLSGLRGLVTDRMDELEHGHRG